ncbi:hypothetical protein ACJIZ3_014157 [Penstemon smallii]|uniref:Ubiquitin-like protease family profile domain-containing protein n=1 Tax=Penstemon smallii TaxID=265156 RepID=A0ABD3RIP6_9LAMI
MGALTSNRKRGDDSYKAISPPIDHHHPQSYDHIAKRPKISVSMSQNTTEYSRVISSNSVVSRVSSYPDTKSQFSREVHAPVRNSKFGLFSIAKKFDIRAGSKESSSNRMGNFMGILERYKKAKHSAFKSLRHFTQKDEEFVRKEKEIEVIEIDDDDDDEEKDKQDDVCDDSSIEEVDIKEWKDGRRGVDDSGQLKRKMELRSMDSSVVTDASKSNRKLDLMVLDQEQDDLNMPRYMKLLDHSRKRDAKLNNLKFDIELNVKRSQAYSSLRSQKKGYQVKKDPVEECFVPLSEEEEDEVTHALHNSNRRKVLVNHENSNIDITGENLQCLKPRAWLNDEVINVYLELLKEREKREPQKFLKCHFFNTFFYKKLISGRGGYNYQSVRRWTTQRKLGYSLLECDKIFVPIHQQIHWCLAIINKKEEKFQYLDSLRGVDSQVLDKLVRYYVDEVKDKTGKDIDVSSWKQEFVRDLPNQENGFDCGMFMIKYADFYSRDIGLCFSQENMPYFRRRTAKEILKLRAD